MAILTSGGLQEHTSSRPLTNTDTKLLPGILVNICLVSKASWATGSLGVILLENQIKVCHGKKSEGGDPAAPRGFI